ncbi:unnamed protein product, partial [Callosobruchus maculatus]
KHKTTAGHTRVARTPPYRCGSLANSAAENLNSRRFDGVRRPSLHGVTGTNAPLPVLRWNRLKRRFAALAPASRSVTRVTRRTGGSFDQRWKHDTDSDMDEDWNTSYVFGIDNESGWGGRYFFTYYSEFGDKPYVQTILEVAMFSFIFFVSLVANISIVVC